MTQTVKQCLDYIGFDIANLEGCSTLQEEFCEIKKAYFKQALQTHPDKGGNPTIFMRVQVSFEVIREMFCEQTIVSFSSSAVQHGWAKTYESTYSNFADIPTPSWEYYAEAAQVPMPLYRIEPARSDRSQCSQRGTAKHCKSAAIQAGVCSIQSVY
jgi:hypothetical protein